LNRNWAYLMLLGPVLFWSGNFVIARAMATSIDPLTLSFWRWALALVVFLPFSLRALLRDRKIILRHWRWVLAMGVLGVAGFNSFVYLGLQYTSATNSLLINSFIPIFILLISRLFLGGRLSPRRSIAIVISTLGVAILLLQGDLENLLALQVGRGDLWILLAALTWAVYSIGLRWRPTALSASAFLLGTMVCGVVVLFPFYLWTMAQGNGLVMTPANLLTIGYVALFASIGAFLLWNQGVQLIGAATAGQFIHLMPLFGTLMAVLMLGEVLYWYHLLGAVAIGSGVLLTMTDSRVQD
jgi:drug/metabolite transporter (DMT)-like permease